MLARSEEEGKEMGFCPRLCVSSSLDATQGPRLPQGRTHPPQDSHLTPGSRRGKVGAGTVWALWAPV